MDHSELTDERHARIIEHCSSQLSSMLAEAEGWYPDKVVTSAQLRAEHGSFCDRLASLASDMGYTSFVELLSNEGFDIELDKKAAATPIGHRIAPEDAVDHIVESVTSKLPSYFEKIDEWYPDRVVTDFVKLHNKTKENLNKQALALGYESWADLLRDYGYEVPDYDGPKGGRKATNDPVAIVDELARRYEGREPAADLKSLRAENPDLASKFSNIANQSMAVFGKTFAKVLVDRGVLAGGFSLEDAEKLLSSLAESYGDLEDKPRTLGELKAAVDGVRPELSQALSSVSRLAQALYGVTAAQLFVQRGIIVGGSRGRRAADAIPDEEIESIFAALRAKYAHTVRPRTTGEFADANPEWKDNSKAIERYLKAKGLGTPAQFLSTEQLISKCSREDSIPRPEEDVLAAFSQHVSGDATKLREKAPGSVAIEFDGYVSGDDDSGTQPAFEMLRVGDYVDISISDDGLIHVGFCGHDLGLFRTDDSAEERLPSIIRFAREWGIVGERVFASVSEVYGGQKRPRANLHVFFIEDESARSEKNGLLLSLDGKRVLDCIDLPSGELVIPEGVETIEACAFFEQPVSEVSLPSTLREIGDEAFYGTDLTTVTIPAGVERIGRRAFTHSTETSFSDPDKTYRVEDGPVQFTVERGNTSFESLKGSLVGIDGSDRRLLSLYYRRPSGGEATLTVPAGITVLGPRCFEQYNFVHSYSLKVPEGVVRMEKGCTERRTIERAELPASLTDIDVEDWLHLCDSYYYFENYGQNDYGDIPQTLSVGYHSHLRIAKGNPRYSVEAGRATALPATRLPDGTLQILGDTAVTRSEAVAENVDEVVFTYSGVSGDSFEYSFMFPLDDEHADGEAAWEYHRWL